METCDIEVDIFYTMGSPHTGVSGLFFCSARQNVFVNLLCEIGNFFLDLLSHNWALQQFIGPASLLNPWNEDSSSHWFISRLNNGITIDQERKRKLTSVNQLALYMYEKDKVVIPKESAWFWMPDSTGKIVPLRDTALYKEDWIGLRQLDEEGRLHFYSSDVPHG